MSTKGNEHSETILDPELEALHSPLSNLNLEPEANDINSPCTYCKQAHAAHDFDYNRASSLGESSLKEEAFVSAEDAIVSKNATLVSLADAIAVDAVHGPGGPTVKTDSSASELYSNHGDFLQMIKYLLAPVQRSLERYPTARVEALKAKARARVYNEAESILLLEYAELQLAFKDDVQAVFQLFDKIASGNITTADGIKDVFDQVNVVMAHLTDSRPRLDELQRRFQGEF